MRRHVCFSESSLIVSLLIIVLCIADGAAAEEPAGSYETAVTLAVAEGTSTVRHELVLPWSTRPWHGTVVTSFSQKVDGTALFDAAVEALDGAWRAALFVNRDHHSSSDPFKLVHASVRGDESIAAVLEWPVGFVQYVDGVPLRRRPGSIVAARLTPATVPIGATFVAYGSERVRHQFASIDGEWQFPANVGVQWGAVIQTGVEVVEGQAVGQLVHTPVQDGAAFARGQLRRGLHSGWLRLHATGPDFRSLTADTYPFVRGKLGLEGRWQWRPRVNRLISLYAQHLQPLAATKPGEAQSLPDYELEASFSAMPRSRWGWRASGTIDSAGGTMQRIGVELTLTDPHRRLQLTSRLIWPASPLQRRYRLQWDSGTWRLRFLVDSGFPGLRAEWRVNDYRAWAWVIVYKRRQATDKNSQADWVHVELSRNVPRFGQLWVRYRDPDLGRLDVGWRRPEEVSGGVRLSF